MSESSRHRRRARHPLLINRTPLFVGVVLIPLAAGCVLGAGGLEIRLDSHREMLPELRAVADRERREAEGVSSEDHSSDEDPREDHLHGPVPPALISSQYELKESTRPSPPGEHAVSPRSVILTPSSGRAPPFPTI